MSTNYAMVPQGRENVNDPFNQHQVYDSRPLRPLGARSQYGPARAANSHPYQFENNHYQQSQQNLLAGQQGMAYETNQQDDLSRSFQTPDAAGSASRNQTGDIQPSDYNEKFSKQRPSRKWLWWLVAAIVLICVILAAVLGGVLGSRASDDDDDNSKENQSMPKSQTGSDNKPSNLVGVFPQSVFDAASNLSLIHI